MKSLLSMEDLTNEEILSLVKRALDLKKGAENKKRNDLFVANLFFWKFYSYKEKFWSSWKEIKSKCYWFWSINFICSKGRNPLWYM